MNAQLHSSVLLPADGIEALLSKKQRIQQEAVGTLPELLVQATVRAAVCLGRKEAPKRVLKPGVFFLARQVLRELARKKGKPSETLMLLQHSGEDRSREHGEPHR